MVINLTFITLLDGKKIIFEDGRLEITGVKDLLSSGIA